MSLAVIIPAAGFSSRMGQPKMLLPWGDTTIIGHHLRLWRELGAVQFGVVCRADDHDLHAELARHDLFQEQLILNHDPVRGMFSSIQCAANWPGWRSEICVWALVLGDQPHVQVQTLRGLLTFQYQRPAEICQPAYEGRAGHPVLLPAWAITELRSTPAATLKDFLKLFAGRCVQYSVDDPGLRLDLDTPEDYKRMLNLARGL